MSKVKTISELKEIYGETLKEAVAFNAIVSSDDMTEVLLTLGIRHELINKEVFTSYSNMLDEVVEAGDEAGGVSLSDIFNEGDDRHAYLNKALAKLSPGSCSEDKPAEDNLNQLESDIKEVAIPDIVGSIMEEYLQAKGVATGGQDNE